MTVPITEAGLDFLERDGFSMLITLILRSAVARQDIGEEKTARVPGEIPI